jgi:hypothetical protein
MICRQADHFWVCVSQSFQNSLKGDLVLWE